MNNDTLSMSRAQLQLRVDAAIDTVVEGLGAADVEVTTNRLLRCLMRRAVKELLKAGVPENPAVLLKALGLIAVDTIKSVLRKGDAKLLNPAVAYLEATH